MNSFLIYSRFLLLLILLSCGTNFRKSIKNLSNEDIPFTLSYVGPIILHNPKIYPRRINGSDIDQLVLMLKDDEKWALAHTILARYFGYNSENTESLEREIQNNNKDLQIFIVDGLHFIYYASNEHFFLDKRQQKVFYMYWSQKSNITKKK